MAKGHGEFAERIKKGLKDPSEAEDPEVSDVQIDGNRATAIATIRTPSPDKEKHFLVKTAGEWKLSRL